MKLKVTGDYSIKVRAFKITFFSKKGKINEEYPMPNKSVKYLVDVPGPFDLLVGIDLSTSTNTAYVAVISGGFEVFKYPLDITQLAIGHKVNVPTIKINGGHINVALEVA